MINPLNRFKKRICKYLGIPYHDICLIEEWSNCFFIKVKRGLKLINKFVSKRAVLPTLPLEDGHYMISGIAQGFKVNIECDRMSNTIYIYAFGSDSLLGQFDHDGVKITRAYWCDEKLGREQIRFIDFEPESYSDIRFKERGHYKHMRVLVN